MGALDLNLLTEELTLGDLDRLADELDDDDLVADAGLELADHEGGGL